MSRFADSTALRRLNRFMQGGVLVLGGVVLALSTHAELPLLASRTADLAGIYRTRQATPVAAHRGPLMQRLEPLMVQQARYLISTVRPWRVDPRAELLPLEKGSLPSEEDGVRPNAHMAKGLAVMYRLMPDTSFPADFTREEAKAHALALLRFIVKSHGEGGVCEDGKPWRSVWQSAHWAALAGEACWLLWDELSPDEKWLAAQMVCNEADRFVGVTPPARIKLDTKAEENAWNSRVIALAYNMFPAHPQHEVWRETAIRWMISSYATTSDLSRGDLVDGRPVSAWVQAANAHDDYTVENHRRVHPDYMVDVTLITSELPMFTWAGNPVPEALRFNVQQINQSLKRLAFPDGGWFYPNAQDWSLRLNADWLQYHVQMALLLGDRQSAQLLRGCLEVMERMAARHRQGSIYDPSEDTFSSQQGMMLELPALCYLLMAQMGEGPEPVGEVELWRGLAGRHLFDAGQFGLQRTDHSIASFSWGTQVMGQVVPLRRDLLVAPNPRGLIGVVGGPGFEKETPLVEKVVVAPWREGFGVAGVINRGGGALEQRFGFVALPDGRVIYGDEVTLIGPAKPAVLNLGTIGVLNDPAWPYYHGSRTLSFAGGSWTFSGANAATDQIRETSAPWFHLEGLGIVCLKTSGRQLYQPRPTGAPGRTEQLFHLNAVAAKTLATAKSGDVLARGVIIFYPGQEAEATRAVAAGCRLLSSPDSRRIRLRLEDRMEVELDLETLNVSFDASRRSTAATSSRMGGGQP